MVLVPDHLPQSYQDYAKLTQHEATPEQLRAFWESRTQGQIQGNANCGLCWVALKDPKHTKALVVVNGRTDTLMKYLAIFYDFFQLGYDICAYDHRGQGLSERITADRQLGHVDAFDDYVADMKEVVRHFPLGDYQQRFLLGHSMGGAISVRYLQTSSGIASLPQFDAVALCAPMLGICLPRPLRYAAKPLSKMMSRLQAKPNYVIGKTAFKFESFADNHLTHCQESFNVQQSLMRRHPSLQLGGPSANWVTESFKAMRKCHQHIDSITSPIIIIQGELDQTVDNDSHQRFMQALQASHVTGVKKSRLERIAGSFHEPFFELAPMRQIAIEACHQFFVGA